MNKIGYFIRALMMYRNCSHIDLFLARQAYLVFHPITAMYCMKNLDLFNFIFFSC